MKLYYTRRSPYARKVRVVAEEKNIPLDLIEVDLQRKTPELLAANPLGKIPTLVLDDGTAVYDSPVICEVLDSLHRSPPLLPEKEPERWNVLRIAALADGMMDIAVLAVLETLRPEEKRMQETVDRHRASLLRSAEALEKDLPSFGRSLSLGSIAVATALGYLDFRMPDLGWAAAHPKLAQWYEDFAARPSMRKTQPSA